jgi:hypothetical protein
MQADHFLWLGLGVWAWLFFGWRLRMTPALIGGAAFMLSGFTMAHESHSPLLWALSWTPWVLWQTRRAVGGRPYAVPLLAACVAMQVAAGYMQLAVMTWMVAAAEAVVLAWRRPRGRIPRRLGWAALGVGLGLGLMTVQFMATRDILPMTLRGKLNYEGFTSHDLPIDQLTTLFFPLLYGAWVPDEWIARANFGRWEMSESHGSMPAVVWLGLLTLIHLLLTRRYRLPVRLRRRSAFWLAVALFSFVMLFGDRSPLAPLLYRLPVYNLFRIQTRWLGFFDLALAALAAVGINGLLDCIERRPSPRLGRLLALATALALLAIPAAWCWLHWTWPMIPHERIDADAFFGDWFRLSNPAVWTPVVFGLLAVAVLGFLLWRPRRAAWAAVLWLALIGLEMKFVGEHINLPFTYAADSATPPGNEAVALMREWSGDEPYRVLPITGDDIMQNPDSLIQHLPSLNHVDSMMGNWPLIVPDYARLLRIANDGATEDPVGLIDRPWLLSMFNCRYLLVGYWWDGEHFTPYDPSLPEPAFLERLKAQPERYPDLRIRARTDMGITIVENTAALPRAWMVERVDAVTDADAALDRLWNAGTFDPRRTALVERADRAAAVTPHGIAVGQVRLTRREPDKLWLELQPGDRPGFVVLSQTWYPGWWLRVDGELRPLLRVNGVMCGFQVLPGDREAYLRYVPYGFKRWAAASLLFGLVWLAWCVGEWIERRRSRARSVAS